MNFFAVLYDLYIASEDSPNSIGVISSIGEKFGSK